MTKHILLTGASRGIGAAIVKRLANEDVKLISLRSSDGDLADPAMPSRLWNNALERLGGRIDVLINNAGVFEANPVDVSDDDWAAGWARTMQINLTASTELSRHAVRHWQARGQSKDRDGRIVNIASRAAHRGDSPAHWHYAASKAGMLGVTKTIARAYAAQDIYAFAICPGRLCREPGRRKTARRYSAWPRGRGRGSRRNRGFLCAARAAIDDGRCP
jgi:3-oxoacyl-[acyl-carrier protein] reductase